MTENTESENNPCIWCCFPCLFFWVTIEKCLQASCLCCCQICACECKTTANEKINNKEDILNNENDNDSEDNIEDEFTDIVINDYSVKATNSNFILYLIMEQFPNIEDDDKKQLINAIHEYKFDKNYEFSFYGKIKYIKYKNSMDINWVASINQQTMDIAEDWSKYDRQSGITGLIERYKINY